LQIIPTHLTTIKFENTDQQTNEIQTSFYTRIFFEDLFKLWFSPFSQNKIKLKRGDYSTGTDQEFVYYYLSTDESVVRRCRHANATEKSGSTTLDRKHV